MKKFELKPKSKQNPEITKMKNNYEEIITSIFKSNKENKQSDIEMEQKNKIFRKLPAGVKKEETSTLVQKSKAITKKETNDLKTSSSNSNLSKINNVSKIVVSLEMTPKNIHKINNENLVLSQLNETNKNLSKIRVPHAKLQIDLNTEESRHENGSSSVKSLKLKSCLSSISNFHEKKVGKKNFGVINNHIDLTTKNIPFFNKLKSKLSTSKSRKIKKQNISNNAQSRFNSSFSRRSKSNNDSSTDNKKEKMERNKKQKINVKDKEKKNFVEDKMKKELNSLSKEARSLSVQNLNDNIQNKKGNANEILFINLTKQKTNSPNLNIKGYVIPRVNTNLYEDESNSKSNITTISNNVSDRKTKRIRTLSEARQNKHYRSSSSQSEDYVTPKSVNVEILNNLKSNTTKNNEEFKENFGESEIDKLPEKINDNKSNHYVFKMDKIGQLNYLRFKMKLNKKCKE